LVDPNLAPIKVHIFYLNPNQLTILPLTFFEAGVVRVKD